jgi:hypothetical protein
VRRRPFAVRGFVQLLLAAVVVVGLFLLLSRTGVWK